MKEEHIILRAIRADNRNINILGAGPTAGPFALEPTGLAVEIESIDRSGISNVVRNRDVVAVAPVIPMKLIEPVATTDVDSSATSANWGIQAVGADTSPFSGDGVVVSVLDTGIDISHPAFAGVTLAV